MNLFHLVDPQASPDAIPQIVAGLPWIHRDFRVHMFGFASLGPTANALRSAGVEVREFPRGTFDLQTWWELRTSLRTQNPSAIHAWGSSTLRLLASCGTRWLGRTLASDVVPLDGKLSWLDRWLLSRTAKCSCHGDAEQAWFARLGVEPASLPRFHDFTTASYSVAPKLDEIRSFPQRLVCVAPLDRAHGVRTAIHAVDILNHLFPHLHLLIAGDGPEHDNLQNLAIGLRNTARVHLLGNSVDAEALLDTADLVWIPSMVNAGAGTALRAMAKGKPILAFDVPCLRDLLEDGVTGYLIPRGDAVTLSRRSRLLLENEPLRRTIGDSARRAVTDRTDGGHIFEQWRQTYHQLAA